MILYLDGDFKNTYPFLNEEDKKNILARISEAVSDLFSQFLDPNTDLQPLNRQTKDFHLYPSKEKVILFKQYLQRALHKAETQKHYGVIFTNQNPKEILMESLKKANIEDHDFFPKQSYLDIVIKKDQIELDMQFQKGQ